MKRRRYRITLEGVVQGVGFRPFVKRLADGRQLPGATFNTAGGLVIELETNRELDARDFVRAIETQAPKAARISRLQMQELPELAGYVDFQILPSSVRNEDFTLVSADLATCAECLEEIKIPSDRRFEYPFTNCTNCGPRYSITCSTPYDRANTTMAKFGMCSDCKREYEDPGDRRFHAEPIACPRCGPQLNLELGQIIRALEAGQTVALKGLGGYQLACDAFCSHAVDRLRVRKRRKGKPFAMMARDLETVSKHCDLTDLERRTLLSSAAPIVLLKLRERNQLAPGVAPGLQHVGMMLPPTPLHHLLFQSSLQCLVMTSGNISEEPIVTNNDEAQEKLAPLVDLVLQHDRDIYMRVDDSVTRVFEGSPRVLRRARGFAPEAIPLGREGGEVLGVGAQLKNTFCLTKGSYAILSQHIGDLDNLETLQFFEETLSNLRNVYQARPQLIAHDLHPDALSTRWALAQSEPKIAVQHHHAHIASCMAENGVVDPVIGVAFDGTGWGVDGQVWGGEFMVCDYQSYTRWAHLRYVALPGGDQAARQPWRMAAAHLYDALGPEYRTLDLPCLHAASPASWKIIDRLIKSSVIQTSSCGRLFDAVSSLCGISHENSYEGESAMLLEEAAGTSGESIYAIPIDQGQMPWSIDTRSMIASIAQQIASGAPGGSVARCFIECLAQLVVDVCSRIRTLTSVNSVCLSGGVFQNFTLLASSSKRLRSNGFEVLLHAKVPPNDGGLSLGQAAIAAFSMGKI